MAAIPILFLNVVPMSGVESSGQCLNSTSYCSFGCCGDLTNQFCCFPVGVLIGCGFGILGTICLLITMFRYRLARDESQTQNHEVPNTTHVDPGLGAEYGCVNPSFSVDFRDGASDTESFSSLKCASYTPPPSYEECVALDRMHKRNTTRDATPNARVDNDNVNSARSSFQSPTTFQM